MRKIPCLAMTVLAIALAACGGGSDGADAATKQVDFSPYAGTWAACLAGQQESDRIQITITPTGPDQYRYEWLETSHATDDCSGEGAFNYSEAGNSTALPGAVTVDGTQAQKVTSQVVREAGTVTETQVVALTPQGLRVGGPSNVSPDGTQHFTAEVFIPSEPVLVIPPAPTAADVTQVN